MFIWLCNAKMTIMYFITEIYYCNMFHSGTFSININKWEYTYIIIWQCCLCFFLVEESEGW